jgi:hypothetical protein
MENVHAQGSCADCHDIMDPVGFAFEHFDAMGVHRYLDNGFLVDSSGELSPALGGGAFYGPRDLSRLVAEHQALPGCLISQIHRNVAGAKVNKTSGNPLASLEQTFRNSGNDMQAFLAAWASDPIFREVSAPR